MCYMTENHDVLAIISVSELSWEAAYPGALDPTGSL